MRTKVKICGITNQEALSAAVDGGASHVGFVFYPRSPRNLQLEEAARLAASVPTGVKKVGVFVDPDLESLKNILAAVPLDVIQLHGKESADDVRNVRAATGLPVMKAASISGRADVAAAHDYEEVADGLLFDAKPPADDSEMLPGGNGLAFDWTLIAKETWAAPWALSGGLTPENVGEALATSGADFVDVSSGVEDAPGVKSPSRIMAFLRAVEEAAG